MDANRYVEKAEQFYCLTKFLRAPFYIEHLRGTASVVSVDKSTQDAFFKALFREILEFSAILKESYIVKASY